MSLFWGTIVVMSLAFTTLAGAADSTRSPHGNLNIPCQNCHTVYGWKPIRAVPEFDHNQTRYPLRGMHEGVNCVNCHTRTVFTNVSNKCADCHADIHRGKMAAACENCHTVRGWKVSVTQIHMHMNRFPLTGAHAAAACEDCHKSGALSQFSAMSTNCITCHQKEFNGTNNPKHTSATFFATTPCQSCHSTDSWAGAKFDHSLTGFILSGNHSSPPRQCADCHKNNNYSLTSADCIGCHQTDFTNTSNPPHASMPQVFGTDNGSCTTCHGTGYVSWLPANFPNHAATGFTLTGAHTVPPRTCADCHINNNYNLTSTACVNCHQTDYNNALTPVNHVRANFPLTCQNCHDTVLWTDGVFNHSSTGFTLTGAHTVPPRACVDCHINNNYNLTSTACVNCHQADYNNAVTPVNHVAAEFPTTCDSCHDTVQWSDGTFNHAATGWTLTGSHTVPPRACADCHTAKAGYNIAVTTCVSCHQTDYNNATTPVNHITANFPLTCDTCHDTIVWTDGKFDHSTTGFTLTGAHTVPPRACTDCHVNNNYSLNSTACVTCHQNDYNNATTPVNHIELEFPTTCAICHDTIAWTDARFDHSKTAFPLTGSHTVPPRACVDCHVNNNYTTLPTACYGCHAADYNGTTNPNHKSAGFPTTCDTCHTRTSWAGATFNHTWFPTNHGGANGVCSTCHTNPNDYSVFRCTNCHLKAQTDNTHQGISGYVYNSVNCYNCHKNGGGG